MHDGGLEFYVHECGIAMYDTHIRGLASLSERSSDWIVAYTMLLRFCAIGLYDPLETMDLIHLSV